jgi:catechol 2,3-dioxygenase-like lactoylglutathione lyase family enzyme
MESRIHISIEVSDLQKSILFYENLFGHTATKMRPDYANFRLDEPGIHLALVLKPDRIQKQNSNEHFGIELFQNERLESWLKDLQKKGLETRVEEKITCCYAIADKFWARDPDGHEWEFWVRQSEANEMHANTNTETKAKVSSCCYPFLKRVTTALQISAVRKE